MFSIDLNRRIRSRMYGGVRGRRYSYLLLLDLRMVNVIQAGSACAFTDQDHRAASNRYLKTDAAYMRLAEPQSGHDHCS